MNDERQIIQDQLYNSLKLMVDWTWTWQEQVRAGFYPTFESSFSKRAWAREHCTVKFALPRQSGNTTMIWKFCNNERFKPIVLLPHSGMLKESKYDPTRVGTTQDLSRFKGITPDIIICDTASLLSNNQINNIYKNFEAIGYRKQLVFLFVG